MSLPVPYASIKIELLNFLTAEQVIDNPYLCLAYGTDASFYRLIPKLVLKLNSVDELTQTIQICAKHGAPYTFRAAGTSLSGQAISDSVLITLTDNWRDYEILDNGNQIRLQPGVIGADANKYLAPFAKKIGPDPASINSCKIGGIAANNSSGMCCGVAHNSYQTVASMTILFADGTILDTGNPNSVEQFKHSHSAFIDDIRHLCEQTKNNASLQEKIQHKYRLKNTTGYSLNALIDFNDPIKAIEHLMIGSEGTLGFIVDITYQTVAENPHKASALVIFETIEDASHAVADISDLDVNAVELMDGLSLAAIKDKPGIPKFIQALDSNACALLIECSQRNSADLQVACDCIVQKLAAYPIVGQQDFTSDEDTVTTLWNIRKGLFPAVGAVRTVGTSVIIEDVAFSISDLAKGVRELQALFNRYNYDEAIIFGHALDGNLHFVFTQNFDEQKELDRYAQFMGDVTELVAVKYEGSLKAEHGTGRNMAPFVELEWGHDAYQLMCQIKALFDPNNLINPGVIINSDTQAHLKNLKPLPTTTSNIDPCIECGFCEPVCPARTLSLSPRQRIVLYRELQHQHANGKVDPELESLFDYQGIETCAATGLCATRCPVSINTGELVQNLKEQRHVDSSLTNWTANHFGTSTQIVRWALKSNTLVNSVLGAKTSQRVSTGLRKITKGKTPLVHAELSSANSKNLTITTQHEFQRKVVYFPSCLSRTLGANKNNDKTLTQVVLSLLSKAKYDVIIPDNLHNLCCGKPYHSKGDEELSKQKALELEIQLLKASNDGEHPIITDTSPCALQGKATLDPRLSLHESSHFVQTYVAPHLEITPIDETVMLHVTCSSQNLQQSASVIELAQRCAMKVVVPEHIHCCGFAGDKGFFTPELNQHALHPLKQQVPQGCVRGFSNSQTCEIGLSHHSGISYQSLLYLVDEASK